MTKFLDKTGLAYFWEKIKALILGKTDKVENATNGNFSGLDASGNLTDSGYSPSDFALASTVTTRHVVDSITGMTSEQVRALSVGDVVVDDSLAYYVGLKSNTYCYLLNSANRGFSEYLYYSANQGQTWNFLLHREKTPPSTVGVGGITNITNSQCNTTTGGDSFYDTNTKKTYIVAFKDSTELFLIYVDITIVEKVLYQKINNSWTYVQTDTISLSSISDVANKADKVSNATAGHIACLDSTGNLTDSGYSPSDLASQEVLICNYNGSTCDKTTQEIYEAKVAGKVVICIYYDVVYYLITATNSTCVFRSILNQDSIMSFNYIKCVNGSWSMGSESWSSKANVSSTPQTTLVTDITALTAEQLNALKLGDIVIKSLDGGYNNHTYTVSYKNGSLGECSLVYSSYDMIEEVSYKKVNNAWTYIETKQRIF